MDLLQRNWRCARRCLSHRGFRSVFGMIAFPFTNGFGRGCCGKSRFFARLGFLTPGC
jgi:hypothetical protein